MHYTIIGRKMEDVEAKKGRDGTKKYGNPKKSSKCIKNEPTQDGGYSCVGSGGRKNTSHSSGRLFQEEEEVCSRM